MAAIFNCCLVEKNDLFAETLKKYNFKTPILYTPKFFGCRSIAILIFTLTVIKCYTKPNRTNSKTNNTA